MLWEGMGRRGLWDPFRELQRMHRDMDRLFQGTRGLRGMGVTPGGTGFEVWTGEDEILVRAQVPGLGPDDLDLHLVGDTLTVKGERAQPELPEGSGWLRRERSAGSFVRTLQLPHAVDPESVEATVKHGLLTIRMKRPEADRPRRIAIRSE